MPYFGKFNQCNEGIIMTQLEYIKLTNPIIKHLMGLYNDDMTKTTQLIVNQAEQNTEFIINSLEEISNQINDWIKLLKEID